MMNRFIFLRTQIGQRQWARGVCLLLALLTGLSSGCTSLLTDGSSLIPWFGEETVLPTRMNVIWSDTILQEPGKPGVRGMGGRMMFYAAQNKDPITVEGTLTVYAYDQTEKKQAEPSRKYVFSADQLPKHYSKSDLGHSYSFWLPWGETDGPPKQLTLIARFEPTEGGAVLSDPAQQHLPGILPESQEDSIVSDPQPSAGAPGRKGTIQPVQHVAAIPSKHGPIEHGPIKRATAEPRPPSSREIITINVPPSFIQGHAAAAASSIDENRLNNPRTPTSQKAPAGTVTPSYRGLTGSQGEAGSSTDSPLVKHSAQNADTLRPTVDPRRTRRRLQAWLSDRRPSRKAGRRGESDANR